MPALAKRKPKPIDLLTLDHSRASNQAIHDLVMKGFPFSALVDVERRMGLTRLQIGKVLWITPSTMARREKQKLLKFDESDRLLRLARLFSLAVELFEGNERSAIRWLQEPARAFDGATPLNMAQTEVGAREVEHLIGRLEHGVFS